MSSGLWKKGTSKVKVHQVSVHQERTNEVREALKLGPLVAYSILLLCGWRTTYI